MVRKKSKFVTYIGRGACIIMAAFILLLAYRFVDSIIDQRSGPFAYFKNLPGTGSTFDQGKAEVNRWIGVGNNGLVALENGRKAGFDCDEFGPMFDTKPTTKLDAACRYKFGFFGERWYFIIFTDSNYNIVNSVQDTTPMIGL
jgi:hypothetical protein